MNEGKSRYLEMKWLLFIKKIICRPIQELEASQETLEALLEVKTHKGDVYGVLGILDRLNRSFALIDRLALIQGCLENKKFCEAFYLARDLPTNADKRIFLDRISKEAAFGDDYSTARNAALLSEKILLYEGFTK